jgi:hypothetical protein
MEFLPEDEAESKEMLQDVWRNICECTIVTSESYDSKLMHKDEANASILDSDIDEGDKGALFNESL